MTSETPPRNPAEGNAKQQGTLRLTSPAFKNGEPIPEKFLTVVQNYSNRTLQSKRFLDEYISYLESIDEM